MLNSKSKGPLVGALCPPQRQKPGFWNDIARRVEEEFNPPIGIERILNAIWFGRFGQIVAAATFVAVIAWCAFWGRVYYKTLEELEINIGDLAYQTCLAKAQTSAELSGAANMIEEPCRRDQAIAQAKVVSLPSSVAPSSLVFCKACRSRPLVLKNMAGQVVQLSGSLPCLALMHATRFAVKTALLRCNPV
jgi:hypothetical protein